MNSKLLKMESPYHVIYAGGRVGLHIATLLTWDDDDDMGGISNAASYPVIDEGEEFPGGTLCDNVELHDCRVLCPWNEEHKKHATNLGWVMKIIEYDFQQIEPAGTEYILERMQLLGCEIKMPEKLYFNATLDIWAYNGPWEENRRFRVRNNRFEGFYFQAEGTAEEIKSELTYQLSVYKGYFKNDINAIRFRTDDGELEDVLNDLNEEQYIKDGDYDD